MNYYENDQKLFKTQNNSNQVVTSRISDDRYKYPRWRNAQRFCFKQSAISRMSKVILKISKRF